MSQTLFEQHEPEQSCPTCSAGHEGLLDVIFPFSFSKRCTYISEKCETSVELHSLWRVVPGISGREEQIGTETQEKKNCPPKEGIEQVAQLAFQSLCSLCSFLFPPDKVLSDKCCFGMRSVFHAAEPVGSEMTPSRVMSVPVGKGPVRAAANVASHLLFNALLLNHKSRLCARQRASFVSYLLSGRAPVEEGKCHLLSELPHLSTQ